VAKAASILDHSLRVELQEKLAPILWMVDAARSLPPISFPVAGIRNFSMRVKAPRGGAEETAWRKRPNQPDAYFILTSARLGARAALLTGYLSNSKEDEVAAEISLDEASDCLTGWSNWLSEARLQMVGEHLKNAEDRAERYADNDQFGSW